MYTLQSISTHLGHEIGLQYHRIGLQCHVMCLQCHRMRLVYSITGSVYNIVKRKTFTTLQNEFIISHDEKRLQHHKINAFNLPRQTTQFGVKE